MLGSFSFNRLNITEKWAVYNTENKSFLLADILAIAKGRKPGLLVKGEKSKTSNPRNCSQCFYLSSSNKTGMFLRFKCSSADHLKLREMQ